MAVIRARLFIYFVEYSAMENFNFSYYLIISFKKNTVDCFTFFIILFYNKPKLLNLLLKINK